MERYRIGSDLRELPLRWANIPAGIRLLLCNGCGGKGGIFNPPDYMFTASCNHHDLNYWLGGTEEDRKKADAQFLEAMLHDAEAAPWWKRWWLKGAAWRYYAAVRLVGGKFFSYGPEKTWDDLENFMNGTNI